MTTQAERITQLEEALARLEADAAPTPTPSAVDPDGYPAHVAPGELVESAWGNAVSDKLKLHANQHANQFVQSGSNVVTAGAGNLYTVPFPRSFAASPQPVVAANNGDPDVGFFIISIKDRTATGFTCLANRLDGSAIAGVIRINWIAHGTLP